MKKINEAPLPGIGNKFWLETDQQGRISIIEYNEGEYEIYLIPPGEEFPKASVRLTSEEACCINGVLPQKENEDPLPDSDLPLFTRLPINGTHPCVNHMANAYKQGQAFIAFICPISGNTPIAPDTRPIQIGDTLFITGNEQDTQQLTHSLTHA